MLRFMLAVVLLAAAVPGAAASLPNQPVPTLDMQRYLGRWHEIAHIPLFFQRKCTGPVTVTYVLDDDHILHVNTTCPTSQGSKTAEGVAKTEPGRPGAFRVRFAPAWLSWLPQAWFDYWVIDIDPDYRWAVIGGPDGDHLWILARDASISRPLYNQLVERARERGYPVDKLVTLARLY